LRLTSCTIVLLTLAVGWGQTPPDTTLRTFEKSQVDVLIRLTPLDIQKMQTTAGTSVSLEQIQKQNPEDLGDLTQNFSGVFVRSYGGAGGLKTMNARGLGSQHFLVINNQQALLFNQMGATNLGDIQVDGLNAIHYSVGGSDSWALPSLAKTYSGVLQLNYLELNQNLKDFAQIQLTGGSFGRYKLAASGLKNTKKATFFAQAYSYQMQGEFPFDYHHGLVQISAQRSHNLTQEMAFRFGGNYTLNAYNKLQFSAQHLRAFRQLPGAIVFYHPDHFQELRNQQWTGSLKHEFIRERIKTIHYANFSSTSTDYRDSFHIIRPQWQNYLEHNFDLGHNGQVTFGELKLNWSGQYIMSALFSSRADILLPRRHRGLLNLGGEYFYKRLKIRGDFPIQYVSDQMWQHPNQNRLLLTPSLGMNKTYIGKKSISNLRFSLGQFSRLATFSEMFYGQIGNPELKPEISQMINTGFHHKRRIKQVEINLGIDAFYGRIKDKIIAIPTQNLFVWSVRNVQTVRSYGFDALLQLDYHAQSMDFGLSFIQKSSLNVAQDISHSESATFGHQIPYTPYWLHHSELTLSYKKLSLGYAYNFNDFRFVLGENIAANVLDAFHLHDVRIHYVTKINDESKHELRIHLKINNLFNEQYQVMRGFPMPGRNFELGLNWRMN